MIEKDIVLEKAKTNFNIDYLYPWQRLVIANILDADKYEKTEFDEDGADRGKQIVLLPTGAGKSLCFLIPALLLSGPTLIIYPLLALMTDQERRMQEAGINSVTFRGGQSSQERIDNLSKIHTGAKVILANPEVLQNEELINQLKQIKISHIAIDEAHCVSEWGDSFRPFYLTLGNIIEKLNVKLITAFTATASQTVLNRISEILFKGKSHIVQGDTDRENIKYSVIRSEAKNNCVLTQVIKAQKPLIVFCPTRKITEEVSIILKEHYKMVEPKKDLVRFYHAGMEKKEKDIVEKWFYPHDEGILVATCAFGMGVDKKNIRSVIHYTAPMTVESFVQEAGRAGRDGKESFSIVIWSQEDSQKRKNFLKGSRENVMYEFAESKKCRREILLEALGAKEESICSGCDICNNSAKHYAEDANMVFKFIKWNRRMYKSDETIQILHQKANKKTIEQFGAKLWTHGDFQEIITVLLKTKKLKVCKFPWKDTLSINYSTKYT